MGKKMGAPVKVIEQKHFEILCKAGCTEQDIATEMGCSVDTISRWCEKTYKTSFADTHKKLWLYGKNSLRARQFACAMENSVPMLIWLGKQYLGQSEKIEHNEGNKSQILNAIESLSNGTEQ